MKKKIKILFSEALFRNSFYIMCSTGTMAIFGFLFWLLVAHLYPPTQVGIASTLVSAMIFISYLSLLGFNNTILRFLPLSKSRNQQIDTSIILVSLAAIVVGGVFVVFAPHFAPKLALLHHTIFYSLGFIVLCVGAALNLIADSIYIAYRSAGYNFVLDGVVGGVVELLLPIALISLGSYGIFAAQGGAAFIAMLLSIVYLVKKFHYRPQLKIDRELLRKVLHYSSWSYISSLLAILPNIVLPIVILNKLGAASAGYYYLAYMMANVLFSIAYAVSQSLFAEGSYGEKQLIYLVKRAALFLSVTIIPASIILGAIGPLVLDFFGKSYGLHGRQVIMILAAGGPFIALNVLGGVILSIEKKLKTLAIISLLNALLVCGLAYAWASKGLPWVAGAWLVGTSLTAVAFVLVFTWQHVRPRRGTTSQQNQMASQI